MGLYFMAKETTNRKKDKTSAKKLIKICGVLFVCIYVVGTLVKQQISLSQCDNLANEYENKIAAAKIEQQMLEDELEKAGTDEYIERTAREKLGLVKANERVFIDIGQE